MIVEVVAGTRPQLQDAARLLTANDREALGEDEPARPLEALRDWMDPPAGRRRFAFLAYDDDGGAVGFATLQLRTGGGFDHLGWVRDLFVGPEARRRGVGSALVNGLRSVAAADGRLFLALHHEMTHESARRFCDHLGARYAMTVEQQRVATANISSSMLDDWIRRAPERAGEYDLVVWDDRCPPEYVDRFATAQGIMNDAPRPESTDDWEVSPEEIRALEATNAYNSTRQWVVAARHGTSGELVGYTEFTFDRHQPWLAHQGDTAVAAAHRERGLGRWLKAVNLRRLVEARPGVTHVETANAGGNEPMLRINAELGFARVAEWQDREYWF